MGKRGEWLALGNTGLQREHPKALQELVPKAQQEMNGSIKECRISEKPNQHSIPTELNGRIATVAFPRPGAQSSWKRSGSLGNVAQHSQH